MNDNIILEKLKETPEFRKMQENVSALTKEQWERIKDQYQEIMASILDCKQNNYAPDSEIMQRLIDVWRKHINEFYYTCDKARLRSYYKLYKEESGYKKQLDNIENGLSDYMADAIDYYLKNN